MSWANLIITKFEYWIYFLIFVLFCLQLLKTEKKVFWSVLEKKRPIFKIQTLSQPNWLMRCIGHLLYFYLITDQMWTLRFRTVLWLVEIYYLTVRIFVVLCHTIKWRNKKKANFLGFISKLIFWSDGIRIKIIVSQRSSWQKFVVHKDCQQI